MGALESGVSSNYRSGMSSHYRFGVSTHSRDRRRSVLLGALRHFSAFAGLSPWQFGFSSHFRIGLSTQYIQPKISNHPTIPP